MKTLQSLLFLSIFLISSQAFCQFSFGIKTGYVRAWQDYGNVPVPADAVIHINGVQATTVISYEVNQFLSIGAEPGFVQRGAACVPGFTTFFSDTKFILNYAELPILVSLRVPFCHNKFEAFGKGGFGSSVILSGRREIRVFGGDQEPELSKLDFSRIGPFNRIDYGLYGGFGLAMTIGSNKILIESAIYRGLRDFTPPTASQNRSLFVGLGYLYNL